MANPISKKFDYIEHNIDELYSIIKNNQDILRYMKYLNSIDPLALQIEDDDGNIIEVQKDINSNNDEIIKNIIRRPFDISDIAKEGKVKVFLNYYRTKFDKMGVNDYYYTLEILCPNLNWNIGNSSKIRPIEIIKRLNRFIDNQDNVTGMGRIFICESTEIVRNDTYSSLNSLIKIKNAMF